MLNYSIVFHYIKILNKYAKYQLNSRRTIGNNIIARFLENYLNFKK